MSTMNVNIDPQNESGNPKVNGAIYSKSDGKLHDISGHKYLVTFNAFPSNINNPSGFCGAGSETYAYIYYASDKMRVIDKILVSSCKSNIFLKSQDDSGEDDDFSSFSWTNSGFKIEWSIYGHNLNGMTKLYDVNGNAVSEK